MIIRKSWFADNPSYAFKTTVIFCHDYVEVKAINISNGLQHHILMNTSVPSRPYKLQWLSVAI